MKKHYKNNQIYLMPDWYKNLMYQLGFRKINDTGREYGLNIIDGEPCRVNKSGRLQVLKDGATADTYGRVKTIGGCRFNAASCEYQVNIKIPKDSH